jgi:hypothetical protein
LAAQSEEDHLLANAADVRPSANVVAVLPRMESDREVLLLGQAALQPGVNLLKLLIHADSLISEWKTVK